MAKDQLEPSSRINPAVDAQKHGFKTLSL